MLDQFINLEIPEGADAGANAVNIFSGHWAYKIPVEGTESGTLTTFMHEPTGVRILREHFPDIAKLDVLELGPHEGEHTYHLNKLAKHIYAVEARPAHFLKCLIVKNELGLNRVRFALGDAVQYLAFGKKIWDICYCTGFLYHMADPEHVISLIARRSRSLVLTTLVVDWAEMERADKRTEHEDYPTRWSESIQRTPDARGYYLRISKGGHGDSIVGHGAANTDHANLVTADRLREIIETAGGTIVHWNAYANHRAPSVEVVVKF